jgi:hypothetical protein
MTLKKGHRDFVAIVSGYSKGHDSPPASASDRGYKAKFMGQYTSGKMSATERRWAKRIGQCGLSARGVTFTILGGFFIIIGNLGQIGVLGQFRWRFVGDVASFIFI